MCSPQFDWKSFQERLGYSDKELDLFRSDPRRVQGALRLESPELQKKYLIFEVESSVGCSVGLKAGNRLFFKGMTVLDRQKSDPWCILALGNLRIIAAICLDRWIEGLDPNMSFNYAQCADTGVRDGGWGKVVIKGYVKDESDL